MGSFRLYRLYLSNGRPYLIGAFRETLVERMVRMYGTKQALLSLQDVEHYELWKKLYLCWPKSDWFKKGKDGQ